jgi:hypothetical protein
MLVQDDCHSPVATYPAPWRVGKVQVLLPHLANPFPVDGLWYLLRQRRQDVAPQITQPSVPESSQKATSRRRPCL